MQNCKANYLVYSLLHYFIIFTPLRNNSLLRKHNIMSIERVKARAKEKLRQGYSRGIFPALQALAVEAMVAESGEDAVD